ncbi:MAG: hypothetical protein WCV50_01090 [Patescibacteria group bacterium]|jgi:hypothetical protein
MKKYLFIAAIILAIVIIGCNQRTADPNVEKILAVVSEMPHQLSFSREFQDTIMDFVRRIKVTVAVDVVLDTMFAKKHVSVFYAVSELDGYAQCVYENGNLLGCPTYDKIPLSLEQGLMPDSVKLPMDAWIYCMTVSAYSAVKNAQETWERLESYTSNEYEIACRADFVLHENNRQFNYATDYGSVTVWIEFDYDQQQRMDVI